VHTSLANVYICIILLFKFTCGEIDNATFRFSNRDYRRGQSAFNAAAEAALGRADDSEVTWIYPPPAHISYPGSFAEVRDFMYACL
jgi:hypothetical protein